MSFAGPTQQNDFFNADYKLAAASQETGKNLGPLARQHAKEDAQTHFFGTKEALVLTNKLERQ